MHSNIRNAMRGISSTFGPRNTSTVWFLPCRPHPERSARYACFVRLRSGGANNKKNNNNSELAIIVIIVVLIITTIIVTNRPSNKNNTNNSNG